jgi:hypothetical protein
MNLFTKSICIFAFILISTTSYADSTWDEATYSNPTGLPDSATSQAANTPDLDLGGMSIDANNTFVATATYDPTNTASPNGIVRGSGLIDIKEFARQAGIERAYEGIALSAALVTTRPLAGDKFSVNINIAEYEGEVGSGIALAFAPSKKVLLNIGVAASDNAHLVRGGVSFSF